MVQNECYNCGHHPVELCKSRYFDTWYVRCPRCGLRSVNGACKEVAPVLWDLGLLNYQFVKFFE